MALLTGCVSSLIGDPDVVIFNRTDAELTADVTLTSASGEDLLVETTTITGGNAFERDEILPSSGELTLAVAVEDGPTDDQEFEVSEDSSLQARIDENAIEFDKIGN